MTTTTVPPKNKKRTAGTTTVGIKRAMAVSGFVFIFFVLFHMYGNLKYFYGEEAYNEYAEHLRTFLQPILPYEGLLWILRVVLIICVIIHVYSAFYLWHRSGKARGRSKYAVKKAIAASPASRYAARTMRWGGIILALFIIWHILQFTTLTIQAGGHYERGEPYYNMYVAFETWWVWLIYVIALAALCLHVWHGVWSALQTLGAARKSTIPGIRLISTLVALVLFVGFIAPPTAILFRLVAVPAGM